MITHDNVIHKRAYSLNNHGKTKLEHKIENTVNMLGRQWTHELRASETQGNYKFQHVLPRIV